MISVFSWFGYELPLKERIDLIRQAGFEGIMLWWGDEYGILNYRDAPKMARDAGLYFENIHAPYDGINNLWLDNLDGDELTDRFLRIVDDCADYEIPVMVLHLTSRRPPPANATGLGRVRRIVEAAEQRGVNVAFENMRYFEHLDFVLRNIDSPYAGFCYDSGHHHCCMPEMDLLCKYGSRIKALHLHDNDGTDDQHRLPYDGTIDWRETIAKIYNAGYKGAIALEPENQGYESMQPLEFLHLAAERARDLEDLAMKTVLS